MPTPIVIHVLRPYASEEEYLACERTSIEGKTMLLIDQPPLAVDTAVIFDVQLSSGQKPIRAEARVVEHIASSDTQPGGLRVRFKRYGAATKAFIDRALNAPSLAVPSVAEPLSAEPAPAAEVPAVAELLVVERAPEPAPDSGARSAASRDSNESSGVHRKLVLPVAAPLNREALLARLRGRRAS